MDPPCPLCEGDGAVSGETCRGCGRPARFEVHGVRFCGRKECVEKLIEKRTRVYGKFQHNVTRFTPGSFMHGATRGGGTWEKNEENGEFEFRAWQDSYM